MILPWLTTEYAGQTLDYIGTDDPENPYTIKTFNYDMKPFYEYPHEVKYVFNSRGYRDEEWPDDDKLQDAIQQKEIEDLARLKSLQLKNEKKEIAKQFCIFLISLLKN